LGFGGFMSNIFGDFIVAFACGDEKSKTMTKEESLRAHEEMCASIGPSIAALRLERRQAAEDNSYRWIALDQERVPG
jgi:hypothetical protein